MATFVLCSRITIGGFKPFSGVNDVVVKKSLGSHLDTALLKIPATSRMKQAGAEPAGSVDTAKLFKRGDRIKIELGYDGVLRTEFEGFVSRVNMRTPCELECEGYAFQLRDKMVNRVWKNTTIKEVLKEIISGTDIVLGEVDDMPFDKMQLIRENGFKCLELVKKACGNVINIWFKGNVLNAGLKYTFFTERNKEGKADVIYKIGWNTIDDKNMKQRELGDNKVEIEFYNVKKDGSRTTAKAGVPNSNYQQKKLQEIVDKAVLKKLARNAEAVKNYTGFEGKLLGFLVPFCAPGFKMKIDDTRYPERSGNYLVESVETKYGRGGARRTVEISFKL